MNRPQELLFLRVPPRRLVAPAGRGYTFGRARAWRSEGLRGSIGSLRVSCFWVGLGRRVRTPGPGLLQRLKDGTIGEVVDIGCAGALDPTLRRGDLVLSTADLPFDAPVPITVRRSPEAADLAAEVAALRGVACRRGAILTHERAVVARKARLGLFEATGCLAVQMEHAWFLRLLESLLPESVFSALRVTHLVLITDAVPRSDARRSAARSAWEAVLGYAFPGGRRGIGSLRRDVLRLWERRGRRRGS
jgi:hypothetical protein